jgi:hypothetical protein
MDVLPGRRKYWNGVAVFLVSLLLTLALQWRGNAYRSEWSGDPDEPAHYVTGLMVHDYIADGLPAPPMAYASRYYAFYPKVALGHWPPLFYVMQAGWTLFFGTSRISLLLLMATLSALWLTAGYLLVASFFPAWMAWVSLVFLSTTADFQASSRMIMAEMPLALFVLLAVMSLARCLDSSGENPDWREGLRFSVLSLAAILTKGTGIALAPLPFAGAALGRRWGVLRSAWFWLPPVLVAVLAAIWFLAAPDALHQRAAMLSGIGRLRWYRLADTVSHWMLSLGVAGSALALTGYLRNTWRVASGTLTPGVWIVTVIFVPVTIACRVLIGPWEVKHLLTTLPLLMLCLCDGLSWIFAKVPRWRNVATALAVAALAATAIQSAATMPAKVHLGLDRAAHDLVSAPQYAKDRFLILSDSVGEGVFIAEAAAHEKRPGHVIERGSKVLAEESAQNGQVRLFFATPEELMRFFEKTPDRIVVVDGVGPGVPLMGFVRETIRLHPDRWEHIGAWPRAGAPLPIEVFRLKN